jgi:hypothetical protein
MTTYTCPKCKHQWQPPTPLELARNYIAGSNPVLLVGAFLFTGVVGFALAILLVFIIGMVIM